LHNDYIIVMADAVLAPFMETFKDFPPRQKPGSFSIDQAMQMITDAASGANH
jgi:arylsulfatase